MEGIASQRAVQLSTVQSYIAEAMAAGYSYPWHRMRLPFSILASLCGHARAYHKQQQLAHARLEEQQQSDAGSTSQDRQQHQAAGGCRAAPDIVTATGYHRLCVGAGGLHQGGQCQQQQQYGVWHEQHRQPPLGQHSECHQQGRLLSVQNAAAVELQSKLTVAGDMSNQPVYGASDITHSQAVCGCCGLLQSIESVMLQPDGKVFLCGDNSTRLAAAQVQSQQSVQLPDMQLVRELVMTSRGTKAIRDSMDTSVLSYGHMRLALAHIYRLLRHHTKVCSCLQTGNTE